MAGKKFAVCLLALAAERRHFPPGAQPTPQHHTKIGAAKLCRAGTSATRRENFSPEASEKQIGKNSIAYKLKIESALKIEIAQPHDLERARVPFRFR